MLDFLEIAEKEVKNKTVIYPNFLVRKSKDLMIRGSDFYAIWNDGEKKWSQDEDDAILLIDNELRKYSESCKYKATVEYMRNSRSGSIDAWHKYCQKQMRDNYFPLDEKIIFQNSDKLKENYSSKCLQYPIEDGECPSYEKIISTLYSEDERHKIEWSIGSIVNGDSKIIQKFLVFYGSAGTGKSTILNIVNKLFDGYTTTFDAKALGSSNASFALEPFKNNPLVAIQHDGDLSHIEDNTRLNSLVSHEEMVVNEKFKSSYTNRFKCFLFMGTNKPVKITDAKSGLLRRLIDVTPTGDKLPPKEYNKLMAKINFELGAIAKHCLDVYEADPEYYNDYVPRGMLGATNDFYNFMVDSYTVFSREDSVSLKTAWQMYKEYVDDAKVPYPLSKMIFKEELKNYFEECEERGTMNDGSRCRNLYKGFRIDKFEDSEPPKHTAHVDDWLNLKEQPSPLDTFLANYPAQYANSSGTPRTNWVSVKTKLLDINTSELHYVKVPTNLIVIDFDIKKDGQKSLELNLAEANKWKPTYAEVSKSGNGIHLHYLYRGNPEELSRVFDENIEVKVYTGDSSLRRMLSKNNGLEIAELSSGLPKKEAKKVIGLDRLKSEKSLRVMIKRNLLKEIHPNTKPSIDFISKILSDAYDSGLQYDVSDMYNELIAFAAQSSNNSDYCLKAVDSMKLKSDDISDPANDSDSEIVFFDCEVFPNLLLINWKKRGKDHAVNRMINPSPRDVEDLTRFKLVGFNCRGYDNHILYARMLGYSNEDIFELSKKLVNDERNAKFSEAFNISYTDVYDFCSKKQSLKKWEIELGIHHKELGLPWDKPVPEELWNKVAEYCDNDVIATEAVFDARQADFIARKIQVEIVKKLHGINTVTVNDTTNTLSTKIIFGANRNPQGVFNWRDMSKPVGSDQYEEYLERFGKDYKFRVFNENGLPMYRDYKPGEKLPEGWSILPFFKGYKFEYGKSTFLGQEIGEGGRVYAAPGMYGNVDDEDITSQHPHSAIAEVIFGPEYTKRFYELVYARVYVKHKDFDKASEVLEGALKDFLNEDQAADLAQALKIVINSIYGLTSASFVNPFRDPNNIDNIVAKRGALFMTLLKSEVERLGYKVAHIKTDSIKIPDATPYIIEFVRNFGKEYGYSFEQEAHFEKFCLVNDAVYIAKHGDDGEKGKWTATGAQFAVPYVFKTLFSHEDITFEDLCETKAVKSALYLDMNEDLEDVTAYEIDLAKLLKNGASVESDEVKELDAKIEKGHAYSFVGKVGLFTPILPGHGGGELVREGVDKYGRVKYASAAGAKGYRWLESETVKSLGKEQFIDKSYYHKLVDEAVETISKFGDAEWFTSDDPYICSLEDWPPQEDLPFYLGDELNEGFAFSVR